MTEQRASILVVDDEPNIQKVIRKVLTIKGYEVELADSADMALDMLTTAAYDLLITDHLMPGKTGLELVIEAQRRHPQVIKILLTGVGNRDLYRDAINKGDVFSVIEKPFQSTYLVEMVDRALEMRFRELAEKRELIRIREQYRTLFETTTDLIQCIDTGGHFIYANPAWHTVLGYGQDEMGELRLATVISEDDRALVESIMANAIAGEPVEPFDCLFVAKDGSHVYIEGTASAQYQDEGVVAVTFILRDITERQRAASKLTARLTQETMIARIANQFASTDQPRSVYDSILKTIGGTVSVDTAFLCEINHDRRCHRLIEEWVDARSSSMHQAWSDLTRDSVPHIYDTLAGGGTVCARNLDDIESPDADLLEQRHIGTFLAFPIVIGFTVVGFAGFIGYEKSRHWEEDDMAMLRASVDIIANAWRRQLDINARKEKEREAEQSRLLVIRADRLAALGTMTAGIIHEITQPLNAINVSTQTILYGLQRGWDIDSEQVKNSLDLIVEQVDRMNTIIKNMRAFTRDGHVSDKEYDNLNLQIDRVMTTIGEQLRAHNIDMVIEKGDLPDIKMNTQQILQVIMNLVTNARQALDDIEQADKQICVSSRLDNETVVLEVEDNGPGVPDTIADRIFDPFFTTKEVGKGTGLGLSISMGFIQEHNGTIELETSEHGGARFIMRLPVHATLTEDSQ